MKYKAILFDLDGTLIDSTEAIVATFNHALMRSGQEEVSSEKIAGTIGYTLRDAAKIIDRKIDDPAAFQADFETFYADIYKELTFLLKDVRNVLAALAAKGYKMGVVTSKVRYTSEEILEGEGLMQYFQFVVGAEDAQNHKPHPEPLHTALEKLNLAPEEVLYVGDTIVDALAAKAAQMDSAIILTDQAEEVKVKEVGARYTLKRIKDLINILQDE